MKGSLSLVLTSESNVIPNPNDCVYNDIPYTFSLHTDRESIYRDIKIFINDTEITDCAPRATGDNVLSWYSSEMRSAFADCFGTARITVTIGAESYYASVSVLVNKRAGNASLDRMVQYVYDHSERYLYEERAMGGQLVRAGELPLEAKLKIVKEIQDVYTRCFGFFRDAAERKLVKADMAGTFEKMDVVTAGTVQYITTHPEELRAVGHTTGIVYNRQNYQPSNTLIRSTAYSLDIYENQAVVGFLKTVLKELDEMQTTVEGADIKISQQGDYINSLSCIQTSCAGTLNTCSAIIKEARTDLERLYFNYVRILNVSDLLITTHPKFTHVFRSSMPYRLIYSCISDWFGTGNTTLAKTDLMLSFVSAHKIYEYYCLLQLCNSIENSGYKLQETHKLNYGETKFRTETNCNNAFVFANSKNDIVITLYFQPVIYGVSDERPGGISLYRNTSHGILYMQDDIVGKRTDGNSYTPDYVLKVQRGKKSKYAIMDAKFASEGTVRREYLLQLIFKYGFSISPLDENSSLEAICFFCGKSLSQVDSCHNMHNIAERMGLKPNVPSAYIINLTGAVNSSAISSLLGNLIYG
jgi:hypothetical protein